jgi:hypothetical protein
MGYKPNEGKGTEVEEDVLVYKQTDANGHTVYARCLGWVNDTVRGLRHAWVLHPRFGVEEMNPREGRLEGFEPVRVVLRDRYDADIAERDARISDLEARLVALENFIEAAKARQTATSAAKVPAPAGKK